MSRGSLSKGAAPQATDPRDAILQAALRLLGQEGHEALSVRRVATEAGCSTIGVYTWFGGKDGLVDAIWATGFASFAEALRRARKTSGPMAMAMAQAKAYRRWALANPTYYRVMFLAAVPGHEPGPEAARAAMGAFELLQAAIADAHEHGELATDDLDAAALMLWSFIHGLVALEITQNARPDELTPHRVATRAFDLAMTTFQRGLAKSSNPSNPAKHG